MKTAVVTTLACTCSMLLLLSYAPGANAGLFSDLLRNLIEEDVDLSPKVADMKKLIDHSEVVEDFEVSTKDVAALFTAVGYENVRNVKTRSFMVSFDDDLFDSEIKVRILVGSQDITARAIFGAPRDLGAAGALAHLKVASKWDDEKRLSHCYVDSDGDFVLESDLFLTKNTAMNAELVKNFAGTFALSAKVFMHEVILAFVREL